LPTGASWWRVAVPANGGSSIRRGATWQVGADEVRDPGSFFSCGPWSRGRATRSPPGSAPARASPSSTAAATTGAPGLGAVGPCGRGNRPGNAARADLRQGTGMGILGRSGRHRCVEPVRDQGLRGRWVPGADRQAGAQSPRADTGGHRGRHRVAHSPLLCRRYAERAGIPSPQLPIRARRRALPRVHLDHGRQARPPLDQGIRPSPRGKAAVPLWTVFEPNGHVLGFVETPAALGLVYEIGEDYYILGHSMDELGVEMIQVWPLDRRGPESASRSGKSY